MRKNQLTTKIQAKSDAEWAVLGGLRFALASIVFWTHFGGYTRLPALLSHIAGAGAFAAVLGFFVVSGYSIAASLERDARPGAFYERRLSRIYPIYFACVILACVPFLLYGPIINVTGGVESPKSVWPVVGSFFFLGGVAVPALATNPVVWSLVIEVAYYLLAPFFARARPRLLVGIICISAVVYWLHSSFHVPNFNTGLYGSYGAVALLWAWLGGFLLRRCPDSRILQSLCLVMGSILLGRFDQYGGQFSPAVFVISVLVVANARRLMLSRRLAACLEYLGELSYPLYLCHVPILLMLYGSPLAVPWAVSAAAVLAVALALLHGIDLPYRAYARRRARTAAVLYATEKSVSSTPAPVPASWPL